ncbi:MAG: CapA family protein [Dehalococcoidia bacterium]
MKIKRIVVTAAFLLAVSACANEATAPTHDDLVSTTPSPVPTLTPSPSPTPVQIPPLTLADIFPPRDLSALRLDPARIRTLIATGDVIPARYTDFTIREQGDDFLYTVRPTAEITSDADITVINLEAPLIEYCPLPLEGFTFCGRPGFIAALEAGGVDVVTLENNHIGNYGATGIDETIDHLEAANLKWADRYTFAITDVRGLKFGFVAFNAVGETIDRAAMAAQIQALRPQVDVLAVAIHWGAEYVSLPDVAPGVAEDNPVELAHLMVDSGADLVIGNHPHWVQGVEFYNGKYITYAHGNFIFDQMWSYETRVGVIGKYTFYDDQLIGVEYTPTLIENYAQPVPMKGPERQAVLDGMKTSSEGLIR